MEGGNIEFTQFGRSTSVHALKLQNMQTIYDVPNKIATE